MTPTKDKKRFRNEDLVLQVSKNVDPKVWDETKYEGFLDELCGHREFQKEAIRTVVRYLLGGKDGTLRELARRNFDENDSLKECYGSFPSMEAALQLPDKLSCTADLATGTGKSYVLYGVAAILLAEGKADRVLVLCPSNTIERGLLEKFKLLAGSDALRAAMPAGAKVLAPNVINASESITAGSMCVENYHAVLEHVGSSIRDSLAGKGAATLVLCDEAHHVANASGAQTKKWKEFLLAPEFGFRTIVGVSGTCYVGDDYFADVVYRYPLQKAIEDRVVKQIEYVAEMPETQEAGEKWQLVYNRHRELRRRLKSRSIRPLTIVVTRGIADCVRVSEELVDFLAEWEKVDRDEASKKVLVVTSSKEHQPNIAKLDAVDSAASPVEWICSVSMLSEGWDVKNVFQIVPHEERAFNSRLLISQVLGRGLRVPEGWTGEQPSVTVFNHDAWSQRIQHLVNEVLEIERRLSATIVPNSPHHFVLDQIDYSRTERVTEHAKRGEYNLLETGYVALPTQVETEDVRVEMVTAVGGSHSTFNTAIQHRTFSAEEVADNMYQRLKSLDEESKDAEEEADRTQYGKKFPFEKCLEIVRKSLENAGVHTDRVTDENRQKLLQALGTLQRKSTRRVTYELAAKAVFQVETRNLSAQSCSAAELRRGDRTVFFTTETQVAVPARQLEFFAEVRDPDGEYRAGSEEIQNASTFKTPLGLVIADSGPERKFVRSLCQPPNANTIDAWVKSTPVGFYSIEYSWKRGTYPKRGEFSPDFFVKIGQLVLVVEVKGDEEIADPSPENVKKYQFAAAHFERLNAANEQRGEARRYQLTFLTPSDFNKFFQLLREGQIAGFRSSLDVELANG